MKERKGCQENKLKLSKSKFQFPNTIIHGSLWNVMELCVTYIVYKKVFFVQYPRFPELLTYTYRLNHGILPSERYWRLNFGVFCQASDNGARFWKRARRYIPGKFSDHKVTIRPRGLEFFTWAGDVSHRVLLKEDQNYQDMSDQSTNEKWKEIINKNNFKFST